MGRHFQEEVEFPQSSFEWIHLFSSFYLKRNFHLVIALTLSIDLTFGQNGFPFLASQPPQQKSCSLKFTHSQIQAPSYCWLVRISILLGCDTRNADN